MKRLILFVWALCLGGVAYCASYSGTLPVMYIQTEGNTPITSKDNYLNATYYIDALGIQGYANVGSASAPLTMEIKGRGNYTWKDFDKKPYRIKLAEKQPLLGMNKSKHFALLAHADDSKGFMRNAVGFELSRMIGLAWTPADEPVEVVLNGEYIGLYFLTETIRVDSDRVNIVEQEDEETNPENITGGWLVEIDNYNDDPHIQIEEGDARRHAMTFTYKTPEVLSSAQEQFLKNEMLRINELVYGDKNSSELWKYLDMDALAKFYIVQEIMDNYESFHGSCYLYREKGANEPWKFGPVWDFGSSFNRDKSQFMFEGDVWHNHWIPEICKFPAFMVYVKQLWGDFYANKLDEIYNYTENQLSLLRSAAVADAKRWPKYGNADLSSRVNRVNDQLKSYTQWLNQKWGNGTNNPSDDPKDDPNNDNPEYEDELELVSMCVWINGQKTEYQLSEIDSITFVQKDCITVKAKVPDTWTETIYVWIWGDGIEDNEHVASKQGDWFVYTHYGNELNIIFKNGRGWTGHPNQTEDIYTTQSACYELIPDDDNKVQFEEINCE